MKKNNPFITLEITQNLRLDISENYGMDVAVS